MVAETDKEKILKHFGFLMGVVFSLVAGILGYKEKFTGAGIFACVAVVFFILGLAAPGILQGVYDRWMRFADVIGRFNTKLILGFIFLSCFSLIRLCFLIFRKDPLKRKFDPALDSYWENHEPMDSSPERYKHQY